MGYTDEDKTIRNFIIIFVIVLLLAVGAYYFTRYVVNKDNEGSKTEESETKEVEIDNSIAIVGTMLGKVESNYYVILYKSDDSKSGTYMGLVSKYQILPKAKAVYTVDLSNALNKDYYDKDNVNLKADNIKDLRFGDITVLEVKDGKIVKSYDTVEKIKKVWGLEENN